MFSDKFGLTEAVLSGRKTMTRRIIKLDSLEEYSVSKSYGNPEWSAIEKSIIARYARYKVGEVVSVAQSYKDAEFHPDTQMEQEIRGSKTKGVLHCPIRYVGGWNNKLFVAPNMMPHRIRITDVRVERLQDISDEDCMAEGVCKWTKDRELFKYDMADGFEMFEWRDMPRTPREAYAALIDRISGKGTWQSNPYVFVYEFELVK